MGKGQRNRVERDDLFDSPRDKKKKGMPKWAKNTIAIALAVVIVLGIVAAVMYSNGTFRRMQVLIKSKTGEFDINRQVATFLAWEIEYYQAYVDYYTGGDKELQEQYSSAEAFAHDYALARVTQELTNSTTGALISTPRDAIDNTLSTMVNFVAVCDYAYEKGVRLEEDEWKKDFTITWYGGMEDAIPVSWDDLHEMMVVDSTYGLSYSNLDLFLGDYFGNGLNSDDVEDALKLICMYEKYLAMYTAEKEAYVDQHPEEVNEYIKNNPNFFYTVEYLSYETEDVKLKDALLATEGKSPEAFKTVVAKDWFYTQGNYKDTYNAFVAMKKAEADLGAIKDLVDNDEKKAWTDKLTALGAVKKTYEVAKKDELEADMSKWLFARRAKYDDELVKGDDCFYVLSVIEQKLDEDGDIASTTVYELTYALEDGATHEGDATFRDTLYKHMLEKKELSDEKVTVNYKNSLANAKAYKEKWAGLSGTEIQTKMAEIGDRYKKTLTKNTTDAKQAIKDVVFDGTDRKAGEVLVAEESDTVAYLVYIDSVDKGEDATDPTVVTYYVAVDADVYYQILTELCEEIDKALPKSSDAYYTSTPNEKTYQYWMFYGANADNGFKSPIAANDTESFTTTVKDQSGAGEDTEKYTVYFAVEPLHLDQTKLVNGGYYSYIGSDINAAMATLDGKTDAALIQALQALSPNSTNTATVSETLKQSSLDEKLGEWMFSADRKANDRAIVEGEDGKTYIAVYLSSELSWKASGEAYYVNDRVSAWLMGLAAQYTPSETVLDWIGDPTPEAEPATTTAAG
ncbi:MAG: hypothetical protein IJW16_03090 [Clostridia bacterium]|nr:hypothetical protein [Clostridia bacterium]